MKKSTLFFILTANFLLAQKAINDPSIVNQEKRQVFQKWGDWNPNPKYFLGIQTNLAYATVWGAWAPARNKRYRNGEDIRPLKPGGIENQRYLVVEEQRKETEKINTDTDTLQTRAVQDFAHVTPLTSGADPLWLLYFKRMLRPLERFPEKPQNYQEWGLQSPEIYNSMLMYGEIDALQDELDVLKESYYASRNEAMPRGKRFVMYTETLLNWRNFISKIQNNNHTTTLSLKYTDLLNKLKKTKNYQPLYRNDKEIVQDILTKYHNQF